MNARIELFGQLNCLVEDAFIRAFDYDVTISIIEIDRREFGVSDPFGRERVQGLRLTEEAHFRVSLHDLTPRSFWYLFPSGVQPVV